ncbi:transglycosylase SLT domain-containing protein [Albimonas sp. CAU 1670]|uniref:transglycosylase SLT domain-containing protein n=1 Tax=Albimonas sp. CAU 1670 TaxID=3032599 RepID=UPI0023DCDE84|nr:transglycosylase SLT domain-containing protein [Albimonas sp. CAU 1670]MDF2232921.1 transglycosylase SLT domain-containing protein [Albimonas sp. CAU 1670]
MMARVTAASLLALGILSGCASDSQPDNVENACAIFDDRPHWERAIFRAERKWNAPAHVAMAIIWKESSFRDDAAPPKKYILGFIPNGRISSAYGFSQALDGTWDWYKKETGNSGADRDDFDDSADFVGWYMAKSNQLDGIDMNDAYNQYLAYHEGHAGFRSGRWKSKAWLRQVAADVHRKSLEFKRHIDVCT